MSLRSQNAEYDSPILFVLLLIVGLLCIIIGLVRWSAAVAAAHAVHPAHPTLPTHTICSPCSPQDGLESINIRIQFTPTQQPMAQTTVRHRSISTLDLGPSNAVTAVAAIATNTTSTTNTIPKVPRYLKKET